MKKSTLVFVAVSLLAGITPALALPAAAPVPLIGVGVLASGATAAALFLARTFLKR